MAGIVGTITSINDFLSKSLNYKNAQHISAKILKHLKMSEKRKLLSVMHLIKIMKH